MSNRGSSKDMADGAAQDATLTMRRWSLLVAATIFVLGANIKGQVPDEPLLGTGGNGTKQNRGENGQ